MIPRPKQRRLQVLKREEGFYLSTGEGDKSLQQSYEGEAVR